MRKLMSRFRVWIWDKVCHWLFNKDYYQVAALEAIGSAFSKKVESGSERCVRCSGKWFPQVVGRGFAGEHPRYCPFCGKSTTRTEADR